MYGLSINNTTGPIPAEILFMWTGYISAVYQALILQADKIFSIRHLFEIIYHESAKNAPIKRYRQFDGQLPWY